jgi:hypothetical protein
MDIVEVEGIPFALRSPHTLDSLRRDAEAINSKPPFLCRIRHRHKVVGEEYIPDPGDDLIGSVLALIATAGAKRSLTRCERCGLVARQHVF